jgi:putative heme iron utilization protein
MSESKIDAHGRRGQAPLAFTPMDVRQLSHAERVRTLLASRSTGVLATIAQTPAGHPYGSYVTYAMDGASPVFLVSRIAEHTKNFLADPRASLLVYEDDHKDPLANARVTLLGAMRLLEGDESASAREAFLGRHPQAAYYADFEDFGFYRLGVDELRFIGGYGRMSWVDAAAYREATADPIAQGGASVLAHMNDDHGDALLLYARAFTTAEDATAASITAVDRYGFEMSVDTPRGRGPARLLFDAPIATKDEARKAFVKLVQEARAKLGGGG